MSKHYTVTEEIYGRNIVAQFSGISTGVRATDKCTVDGSDNMSMEKLANYLFEYVIVEPKLSIKDFGADKIGNTVTKKIGDTDYTAKFDGLLTAIRAVDENYNDENGNTSTEKFAEYLFKHIIVKPEKLEIDDFETAEDFKNVVAFGREVMQGGDVWKEFNQIITFANKVMNGQFRDRKNGSATPKASKG